jgi:hypothetical protein
METYPTALCAIGPEATGRNEAMRFRYRRQHSLYFFPMFVLQTFAAHLTAIEGSKTIPGLHDQVKPIHNATAGLGLSAATVKLFVILVRFSDCC